jgi:hypothetical protein
MSYFNIYHHEKCIQSLEQGYDAVGVNFIGSNKFPYHYSGHFWWSKSSHIRNLNIDFSKGENPEFWVTSKNDGKYCSLWNSGLDHFANSYKHTIYENKI